MYVIEKLGFIMFFFIFSKVIRFLEEYYDFKNRRIVLILVLKFINLVVIKLLF